MIYILLFIIIIAISAFLAFRSMKSFQEIPSATHKYSLFLLKNPKAFSLDTLTKLYAHSLSSKLIFSIEVLLKGNQAALALYAPASTASLLPELQPIEIEDYLGVEHLNQIYSWAIQPKNNPKKVLTVSPDFLKMTELEENQKFFWQIVLTSVKADTPNFQATIRAMVEEGDPIKRVELAKKIDKEIESCTGLVKNPKQDSVSSIFSAFIKRTLTPKQSIPFVLKPQEVLDLIGRLTHY